MAEEKKMRVFVTLRPEEDAPRKKDPMKLLWLERRGVSGYDINNLTWRIRSLGGPFAEFKEMDLYIDNEKLTADRVHLNEDCVLQVAQKVADMTDVIDIPDSRIATTELSSNWQWNKIPARWNALLWRICLLLAVEEGQKVDDRIGRGPHIVFLQVLRESSMLANMIPSHSEREEFLRQLMEEIRFPNSKISCVHVLAALRALEKKREIKVASGFFNQLNPPAFARTAVITTSDEKMKFRINVTDNLDPGQSAARIVEQFNLHNEEVEFLTGALQHEQCACLQQELPRQKEAWKAFQQQISAVERLMLEFDRVATTALINTQKPKLTDVRTKQPVQHGVLVKKFARQIVEAQEELARLRSPNTPHDTPNKGVLLGGVGPAQDESDNEFKAADRDGDGVITRQEFDSWVSEKRSLVAAAEADHRQLTNENMRLRGQIAEIEAGHKIYKQLQAWEREKQQLSNDIERLRKSERLVHDLRTAIFEQLREAQEAADSPDKDFELKEGWLRLSHEEIQERKRQEFTLLDKVSQEEEERWRTELNQLQQRLAALENEVRAKDAHANDLEVTSRSFGQFD